jgi:hypothetical protein
MSTPTDWIEISHILRQAEEISKDGTNVVIKIDGERLQDNFTVVFSGGPLGDDFFRKDGADLKTLLQEAIAFYTTTKSVGR